MLEKRKQNTSLGKMFEQIKKSIGDMIRLEPDEMAGFLSKLQVRRYKRKAYLLSAGEVCRASFFVNSGLLRYFNLVEGEEITGQFFFENAWYADYASYLSEKPSEQTIQALEDTEVLSLSKIDLEKLYKDIPQFERFGRLMAEHAFLGLRQRNELLTQFSPDERYLKLLRERPKVLKRVSQHYIASYLGIRPQSLSRIRSRLAHNR